METRIVTVVLREVSGSPAIVTAACDFFMDDGTSIPFTTSLKWKLNVPYGNVLMALRTRCHEMAKAHGAEFEDETA